MRSEASFSLQPGDVIEWQAVPVLVVDVSTVDVGTSNFDGKVAYLRKPERVNLALDNTKPVVGELMMFHLDGKPLWEGELTDEEHTMIALIMLTR